MKMKSLFLYLSIYTHNVKRFSICENTQIYIRIYSEDGKDTQLIPSSPFQFFYRMIFTFITSNITQQNRSHVLFNKKKLIPSDHDLFILTSIVVLFYVSFRTRPPSRCYTSHSFLSYYSYWIELIFIHPSGEYKKQY